MTDSPWGKDVTVALAPAGAPDPEKSDASAPPKGSETLTLNITWVSSLPIKQAMLKSRFDEGDAVARSAQEILNSEEGNYIVVLTGLPLAIARSVYNPEKLKQSSLNVDKKSPIQLAGADFDPHGGNVDVIFVFPKTSPITAEDMEVEVFLNFDRFQIRRKFSVKDMMYKGKLEM